MYDSVDMYDDGELEMPSPKRTKASKRMTLDPMRAKHKGIGWLRRLSDWLFHGLLPTLALPIASAVLMALTAATMTGGLQASGASTLEIVFGVGLALVTEGTLFAVLHRWSVMNHMKQAGVWKWAVPTVILGTAAFHTLVLSLIQLHQHISMAAALAETGFTNPTWYDVYRAALFIYTVATLYFTSKKVAWPEEEQEVQRVNGSPVLIQKQNVSQFGAKAPKSQPMRGKSPRARSGKSPMGFQKNTSQLPAVRASYERGNHSITKVVADTGLARSTVANHLSTVKTEKRSQ